MKKTVLLITALIYSCISFAQTITVVDKTTQQTLPGVAVYTSNAATSDITSAKGTIDITVFKSADSIYFRHVSYATAVYTYSQLELMKLKLRQRIFFWEK